MRSSQLDKDFQDFVTRTNEKATSFGGKDAMCLPYLLKKLNRMAIPIYFDIFWNCHAFSPLWIDVYVIIPSVHHLRLTSGSQGHHQLFWGSMPPFAVDSPWTDHEYLDETCICSMRPTCLINDGALHIYISHLGDPVAKGPKNNSEGAVRYLQAR